MRSWGRRKERGMSLSEILISIMILSIGILGTLGSLTYGLRSASHGEMYTQAVGFNRQIIEMMMGGGIDPVAGGGVLKTAASGINDAAAVSNPLRPPTQAVLQAASLTNGWRRLTAPPFDRIDLWVPGTKFGQNTSEVKRFQDVAQNFERLIYLQYVNAAAPGSSYEGQLVQITSTIRWRDKLSWKSVTTQAVYNVN